MSTDTVARPSEEERRLIESELSKARGSLVELELLAELEQVRPAGVGKSLLEFRSGGVSGVPSGARLQSNITCARVLVELLEAKLADIDSRTQAWIEQEYPAEPGADAETSLDVELP